MSDKLNFLFIITDMQKRDHLSCYNSDMVLKTPNIDKIAEEGTKFTNFYCNNPICMPNRSTIYTGQYPSVHGVTTNGRNLPKDIKTFTDVLLESGLYHTASFGKIHLNYFGVEHKLIETAENLISREFLLPKDFPNLTHELPFYGLEEVELITGHGWMCSHPDYLNWIKEKIKIDENLGRPLKIKPEHPIKKIFRKIVLGFKIKGTFRKLQIVNHKMPEELYSTSYVKERTIKFLEKFAENEYSKENFFTFCSFPDPHHSFSPPERYLKMYKPEDIKLNATFYDNHEKSPGFMKKHYNEGVNTDGTTKKLFITPKDLTELDAQRVIAASYGMEKMIDDAVGEILDTLEKTGLAENTVVIYTTDHGELGGDHRFFFKGPFLYEALAKIPFLIKVPNLGNKKVSSSLTSSLDIAETILELAELPIPDSMQGKSLVPILKNPDGKINEEVLIEMDEEIMGEITRTLITDGKRITIFMAPENDGELYDLIDDPDEMNNLWKEESYKEIKTNLLIKLAKKMGLKITENSEMEQILDGIRDYLRNYNSPITRECQF